MDAVISILINRFVEELNLRRYAQNTITSYKDSLTQFIRYLALNDIEDIRQITIETVNNYKKYQQDQNKYSAHTIHMRLRAIKRFFEFLEKTNQLLINPCRKLIMPKLGGRLPKNILTRGEVKKILESPNTSTMLGIRNKTILELLYTSGIRLNECANLKVHDIDYVQGYMRINQGKGGKDRVVPIGKKACEYLREYILRVRPRYADIDERALFISGFKKPLLKQSIAVMVKKHGRRANIKKPVTPHTFRRTFATHMLQEGANPYYIQRLLGHEDGSTLSRYIKLIPKEIKQAHKKHHPREKDQWRKTAIHIKRYN